VEAEEGIEMVQVGEKDFAVLESGGARGAQIFIFGLGFF
jgi:hypothetical protein